MIAEPTPTKAAPSSAMLASSSAFEAHLADGRGYSAHTVKAYLTDVSEFLIMFAADFTDPSEITLEHLRDWLWRLSESGLAKSSLARKSASLTRLSVLKITAINKNCKMVPEPAYWGPK